MKEVPGRLQGERQEQYNCGMLQVSKVDLVGVGLNATDTLIKLSEFPECGSKLEYESERQRVSADRGGGAASLCSGRG